MSVNPYSANRYLANHFTGANVTIHIGSSILTQAFGVQWEVHRTKRPIFGYNSIHWDAVSNGQTFVTGALFINFTHPAYLSTLLSQYVQFTNFAREAVRSGRGEDVISHLENDERVRALVDIFSENLDSPIGLQRGNGPVRSTRGLPGVAEFVEDEPILEATVAPDNPERNNGRRWAYQMSNSERTRNLDGALDVLFNDENLREDMIAYLTGGAVFGQNQYTDENGLVRSDTYVYNSDDLGSIVERDRHLSISNEALMQFARPDQFGNANSSPHGIDVVVHFGPPYGGVEQNRAYNYSTNSAIVLRDVVFNGESTQIMSDDQPVLEVYKFMARKKETLPRSTEYFHRLN